MAALFGQAFPWLQTGLRSYPLGWWGHPLTRWTDPAVFTASAGKPPLETTAQIQFGFDEKNGLFNDCLINIKCSPNLLNMFQNPICWCLFHGIMFNDCLMGLLIFHAWIQCVDWSVTSRMVIIVRLWIWLQLQLTLGTLVFMDVDPLHGNSLEGSPCHSHL